MGVRMGKKSRKGVREGKVKMGKGIGSVKGVQRGKKSGGREGLKVREEGYVKIEKGAREKGRLV